VANSRSPRNAQTYAACLAALLAGGVSASAALAFVPSSEGVKAKATSRDGQPSIGIRVVRPALSAPSAAKIRGLDAKGAKAQVDRASAAVRLISGGDLLGMPAIKGRAAVETYVERALRFAAEHADVIGVEGYDLALNHAATLIDSEVAFLKFDVYRAGILVQDASLDFRWNHGRLVQVANLTFAEAATDLRGATAGLDEVAAYALGGGTAAPQGDRYRVEETESGYRLVRVAQFETKSFGGDRFTVQVEAATGRIFEIRPTRFELNGLGAGQVHARWYNEPLTVQPYVDLTLNYTNDGTSGAVTTDGFGRYSGAPDASQPTLRGFSGSRVKISVVTGTPITQTGAPVRDEWHVVFHKQGSEPAINDKSVAQSMVYYHTNAMIQRAKAYVATPWLDAQLTANVNLGQTCNAHWDGSTINFYSGDDRCANTGLISDVVYHEWGHGLDANTGGIADGAYSEGFGDIMSLIMTHSNQLGIGFRVDGSPVRDLAPDKIYPQDQGEVHAEGLIIGSTFWDLFTALKDEHGEEAAGLLLNKYALKTIFTASRYTDVYAALLVVDDDNGDLTDGTPNYCTVNKAFAAHGLATPDQACELAGMGGVRLDDDQGGDGDGVIEPGETVDLWVTATNAAPDVLSGLTGALTVSGAAGVSVDDAHLAWDDIPARMPLLSNEPATISVARDVACGTALTATIALQAGPRTATVTAPLSVGRLVGEAQLHAATGLPMPIADNQTTTVAVTVDAAQWNATTQIQAAVLKIDLRHTYVGDLTATLVSPAGQRVEVWRGSGAADDLHFEQDVTAKLSGIAGKGEWKLEIRDSAAQDVGFLDLVQLTMTPAAFECE
jgi:subtilisin-like proprotein convertase family protein